MDSLPSCYSLQKYLDERQNGSFGQNYPMHPLLTATLKPLKPDLLISDPGPTTATLKPDPLKSDPGPTTATLKPDPLKSDPGPTTASEQTPQSYTASTVIPATTNSSDDLHLQLQTPNANNKPYPCPQCKAQFKHKKHLKEHLRLHDPANLKFACDASNCGKKFLNKSRLDVHRQVHTGEKPFKCETCGKSFSQKGSLTVHERFHNGQAHSCPDCGHKFTRLSQLKIHQLIHTGERPYTCSACGRTFTSKSNLNSHKRVHSGEKPYKCTACHKAFAHLAQLKRHGKSCPLLAATAVKDG